jgi:hypothetical protein
MPAYAVAHMRQVTMGPPIVEYLERIDATLAPFNGRFAVHRRHPGRWSRQRTPGDRSRHLAPRGRTRRDDGGQILPKPE